jgi:hypothetical protein
VNRPELSNEVASCLEDIRAQEAVLRAQSQPGM